MVKDKKYIFIISFICILIIIISYLLFKNGTTNKLKTNVFRLKANVNGQNVSASNRPVINMVVNSSGEKPVNSDVSINVFGEGNDEITNIYYSFDLKKWYDDFDNISLGNSVTAKKIFKKAMNEIVYIKLVNKYGYESYSYKTIVIIDREKPIISLESNNILMKDNIGIRTVQYSNDLLNWDDSNILDINLVNYKYARAVDTSGNISRVLTIK